MNLCLITTCVALSMGLSACAAPTPQAYRDERPQLDIHSYLNGRTDAWGFFSDRSGRVTKRFTVVIVGEVEGDTLILNEDFTYSDGTTSQRRWNIRRVDDHTYTGTAADVVGTARGVAYGNALHWTYVLALDVNGKTYNVDFDDWMYLQDGAVMLNRSVMKKFGFRLGEVFLAFAKAPDPAR